MFTTLWNAFQSKDLSMTGKVGTAAVTLMQFIYKRRKSGSSKDAITESGFGK